MTEVRTIVVNGTNTTQQDFNWDSQQKGFILSSFFYGYITTQFIGGYVATKIGGNRIFGIGIGMTAILTLLTPLAANLGFAWLLAIRIVEGVFEGVSV
jgi:ACS family sodium-dependent inorganic phosphate cotransporter